MGMLYVWCIFRLRLDFILKLLLRKYNQVVNIVSMCDYV